MQLSHFVSPRAAMVLVGVTLVSLTFACSQTAPTAPTPVPADPFIVVRATSQAAYTSGKAHLDRGEFRAALVDLDTASTNDPDNRQDIQRALGETLSQLALETPSPEPTSPPRGIVVTTVPAGAPATPVAAATLAA